MKILLWAAIGFFVVMWLLRSNERSVSEARRQGGGAPADGEAMVRCAKCGTFVPASEALKDAAGNDFCSEEHRRQA